MCSTAAQRIAEIGRAIDDLAVQARPAAQVGPANQAGPAAKAGSPAQGDPATQAAPTAQTEAAASAGDTDPIVARLAELWGLLAELDPEVARRLAGYQNLSALTDLWPTYRQEVLIDPPAT